MATNETNTISTAVGAEGEIKTLSTQEMTPLLRGMGGLGFGSLSGCHITEGEAYSLTGVYNAINIYANAVATLDLGVYRWRPNGGKQPVPDHPINYLVACEPNEELTAYAYWHTVMCHVLSAGNSYSEIERGPDGRAVAIRLLDPHSVQAQRDRQGRLFYANHSPGAGTSALLAENVLHFRAPALRDGIVGMSPITVARESLSLARQVQEFASNVYNNGASVGGVFEMAEPQSQTAQAQFREQLDKVHGGAFNAQRPLVLPFGMKYTPTVFSAADSEYIASRNFSIAEIARLFNVPQSMLGNLDHTGFSTVEELNSYFYEKCLMPWLVHIEQECNRRLFFRSERDSLFVFHDYTSYLRANTSARTAYYAQLRNIGVLNTDEIRQMEMMNPIGPEVGGDTFVVQGAFIPLKDVGKAYAPGSTISPTAPPNDGTTAPPPSESTASTRGALDAFGDVLRDQVDRCVRREAKAIRKAGRKPDEFLSWLETHLDEHRTVLDETLAPSLRTLEAFGKGEKTAGFVGSVLDESRASLEGLVKTVPPDDLPAALDRLCEDWERGRTTRLVDGLLGSRRTIGYD